MPEERIAAVVRAVGEAVVRASRAFEPQVRVRQEGRVLGAADGVLRLAGLPDVGSEEVVAIGRHGTALVLGLGRRDVSAIALQGAEEVHVGQSVRPTGRAATIAAGDALLGRVVDALGRPLDGLPLRGATHTVPLDREAPGIRDRTTVHAPLYTGILAIDAMLPIGRGQRELVLGEEGTGKTALALDVLLRQRDSDVVCVYVAIGRRRSDVWQLVEELRKGPARWVVVAAFDDASAGLRYLAPYAGTAVAEHFTYRGEHALVVHDDLTTHAIAWRELSLLLRRSPGREAYPGDVFYLHARLLERAAQLSADRGGGSLTALPLASLESGRLTAYIPTNLISITDGQIVLSPALFSAGQKPAIDAGLSVSRVGSKAQSQALRELAGQLRLEHAAFLELESFTRLGTRLEDGTRRRVEIGHRVRALLRGERLAPLSLFDEVTRLVVASAQDLLLRIPTDHVCRVADEVATAARRELGSLALRVERDQVLATADQAAIAGLLARLVEARFPSRGEREPASGPSAGGSDAG